MKPAQKRPTAKGMRLAVDAAQQYAGRVKGYLASRLRRRPQDVDDLAQEVYLRLLRMPEETLLERPAAYLYRVAANVVSDFCAKQQTQAHVLCDSDALESIGESTPMADPTVARELQDDIERAVAELPPRLQATILLRERGYSYEEIARQLQVTPNTVRKHLAVARARLRVALWGP